MAKKKDAVSPNQEKINNVISTLDKKYGEGSMMQATSKPLDVPAISTGSLGLDLALGVGGVPEGRIIEIFGPESSGKTTLCWHVAAEAQKKYPEKSIGFVDMEHASDIGYAQAIGVDLDKLYISQPQTGEEAIEIAQALIESGVFSVVIVDSVAALVPLKESEGETGDAQMGAQARLMSQAMRKLSPKLKEHRTTLIFTNQLRMKIGVVYGNPEVTTGGGALKFYASIRMDIRKKEAIKAIGTGGGIIANKTRVKVIKNKVAPPFREAEFDIVFGEGIDRISDIFTLGKDLGIIDQAGAYFSFNDTRIGQGMENSKNYLRNNPDVLDEVTKRIVAEKEKTKTAVAVSTNDETDSESEI
jgi:recombination protein RecA